MGEKPSYEEVTEALATCQRSLAMLIGTGLSITGSTILSAYASCLSAETIARSVLSRAQASAEKGE